MKKLKKTEMGFSLRRHGQHVYHLRPESPGRVGGGEDGTRTGWVRRVLELLQVSGRQEHHHGLGGHEDVSRVVQTLVFVPRLFLDVNGTWKLGEKRLTLPPTMVTWSP